MATVTSAGSGAWSSAGTWDSGVPADGDTVVVAAGHAVEFDVDHESGAGISLAGLTIHGGATPARLYAKYSAAGTYTLRMAANADIVGTTDTNRGQLCATVDGMFASETDLPYDRKFTILLQGTGEIVGTDLDLNFRGVNPTNRYVEVYGATYGPVDQTTEVDVDNDYIDFGVELPADNTAVRVRSSDTLPGGLADDDIYYVYGRTNGDDTNSKCKLVRQSNQVATLVDITSTGSGNITLYTGAAASVNPVLVIQDITSDQWADGDSVVLCNEQGYDQQRLTITDRSVAGQITLSAATDSIQYPLAKLVLATRNVAIRSSSTTAAQPIISYSTGATHGGVFQCEIRNTAGTGTTFYGYGVYYGVGHTISGTISGCSNGCNYGAGHAISGTISGCSNGCNSGAGHAISGTISGCSSGCKYGSYFPRNAIFTGNIYDFWQVGPTYGYGSSLRSGTQNYAYLANYSDSVGSFIYDYKNSSGTLQKDRIIGWTSGGYIEAEESSVPADPPVTLDWCHKHTFESASHPVWCDQAIRLLSGQKISIPVYIKLSQTGMTETPRVQIIDPNEPWDSAASKLDDDEITDTTDWQTVTVNYTADYDKEVLLRVRGTNASGDMYWWADLSDLHPTLPTAVQVALDVVYGYTRDTLTGTLEVCNVDAVAAAVVAAMEVEGRHLSQILEDTSTTIPATLSILATAQDLATVDANVDAILADTGTDGVVVASASKTGYSLAASGLDAITATEPTGKPTTFPGWIMWLIQRLRRANKTTTDITVLSEAGATITTQAITDDGAGTETLGPPA
jgi:hypothetical protein